MKKLYLDIGFDYDFLLFGIVSQEKSHRLAWDLNQSLGYLFKREDELIFHMEKTGEAAFDMYAWQDEINHLSLHLLSNREESVVLVPELRNIDYFVVVKGALEFFRKKKFTSSVTKLGTVQLISEIDHTQLKSKQNLIF